MWRWRFPWGSRPRTAAALALALLLSACAATAPPPPPQPNDTDSLLMLITKVIESTSAEERRSIESAERARVEASPDEHNRLRLAMVRAFGAALPSELMEARTDLQALANRRRELSDNQWRLALMALIMVDQRLQMGTQITDLQRQIDSLTEIEASLNNNDVNGAAELAP